MELKMVSFVFFHTPNLESIPFPSTCKFVMILTPAICVVMTLSKGLSILHNAATPLPFSLKWNVWLTIITDFTFSQQLDVSLLDIYISAGTSVVLLQI